MKKAKSHFESYSKWLETESRLKKDKGIDRLNQRLIKKEVQRWRDVLERLLSITLFLAEHNLAFRGSSDKLFTPNNGNFLGLVQLLGKFDETMREHLRKFVNKELPDHYCGKNIQNEFINLLGEKVLENIFMRLKKAKYYSVILDCTPDISHSEKMSFTLRFVDEFEGQIYIREHFIGYENVGESSGEALFDLLKNTLSKHNVDMLDMRGQGYDNGANMRGKYRGVQARVLSENPRAIFVP